MCEQEFRCDYLTPALWQGASSSSSIDEIRDLITETFIPEHLVERVRSALSSGYTRSMFNGSVAYGSLEISDAETVFLALKKAFNRCCEIDHWEEQGAVAVADLRLTLNLIQIEILESIGRSGLETPEALSLLISALSIPNDALHFAVLHSIQTLGNRASEIAGELKEYLNRLDLLDMPKESIPRLRDAVFKTLKVFGHD